MNTPQLKARFLLDRVSNQPRILNDLNYVVEYFIENPPPDTYAVNYELDRATYDDPIRESFDKTKQFRIKTTSYGDYLVVARIRSQLCPTTLKTTLYQALKSNYPSPVDPAIDAALANIRNN